MNNNKEHRMIKAVPNHVFNLLELSKQKINRVYYDIYKKGTTVIKRPESGGTFSNRIFNFDPEPYVIGDVVGRKYRLVNLSDMLDGKVVLSAKHYQPYEIRAFLNDKEFLQYLTCDLIKNSLINLYGENKYNYIVEGFKGIANQYTKEVK
jgi:hypothetical protein